VAPEAAPSPVTLGLYICVIFSTLCFVVWLPSYLTFSTGSRASEASYLTFSTRSRASEAKHNLSAIVVAHIAYYAETDIWAGSKGAANVFEVIGWNPEGNTRYAYYCGDNVIKPNNNPNFQYPKPGPKWPFSIRPKATSSGFNCMAIGDIDSDEFLDVWMIDDRKNLTQLLDDAGDKVKVDIYGTSPESERSKLRKFLDDPPPQLILLALPGLLCLPILLWMGRRDGKRYQTAMAQVASQESEDQ